MSQLTKMEFETSAFLVCFYYSSGFQLELIDIFYKRKKCIEGIMYKRAFQKMRDLIIFEIFSPNIKQKKRNIKQKKKTEEKKKHSGRRVFTIPKTFVSNALRVVNIVFGYF